jgi:hypothetical protein
MDAFMSETVEVTLKVAELVDLIEAGAISSKLTGYEPQIVTELRELFTRLAQDVSAAADEV